MPPDFSQSALAKSNAAETEMEKKSAQIFFLLAHCDWFIYHGLDLPPCEWHFGIVLMMPQSLLRGPFLTRLALPRSVSPPPWPPSDGIIISGTCGTQHTAHGTWPPSCSWKALHLIWLGQLVHVHRHRHLSGIRIASQRLSRFCIVTQNHKQFIFPSNILTATLIHLNQL